MAQMCEMLPSQSIQQYDVLRIYKISGGATREKLFPWTDRRAINVLLTDYITGKDVTHYTVMIIVTRYIKSTAVQMVHT